MTVGTLLLVVRDVTALLVTREILHLDGSFDQAKLDTIQEDLSLTAGIELILKEYGVTLPAKVDKIIQLLPLVAALSGV